MKKKPKSELINALGRFGYPLFQPENTQDPNELLAALAQSDDARLMEGFPVVLGHCLAGKDSRLDLHKAEEALSNPRHKGYFRQLVALSQLLFDLYTPDSARSGKLPPNLNPDEDLKSKFFHGQPVKIGNQLLDPGRFKSTFLNYTVNTRLEKGTSDKDKAKIKEEFQREFLLSLLLSPRQKDLVYKKLRGEGMTKTEKEYFSRVVKKKLQALADPDLHVLAQKALQ